MSVDPSTVSTVMSTTTAPEATVTSEQWYCDQCGARYANPGVCTNQHPANELKPISAPATATTTTQEAAYATSGYAGTERRVATSPRRTVAGVSTTGTERRSGPADRRNAAGTIVTPSGVVVTPSGVPVQPLGGTGHVTGFTAVVASPEAQGSPAADLAVVSDAAKASLVAAVHGLEQALTDFKTLIGV